MDVAANRGVELLDAGLIQFHPWLLFDPRFELGIAWLLGLDKIDHGFVLEPQGVKHHLVVAFANARIPRRELAALFARNFQPKTRQMQNTERTRHPRTNQ